MHTLRIIKLPGLTSYAKGLDVQTKIVESMISEAAVAHTLLLMELPPTFTSGRRNAAENDTRFYALGAEYHTSLRGGLTTFHGPGQLVGYPIFHLKSLNMGVRQYVKSLEQVLIDTLGYYSISASRTKDTGVWIDNRKIAAIGIHVSRYITSHGFALNCSTDLNWFKHIVPCGLVDKQVTSILNECTFYHSTSKFDTKAQEITPDNVSPVIIDAFKSVFHMKEA